MKSSAQRTTQQLERSNMSKASQPVKDYMTAPVQAVRPSDDLDSVYQLLVGLEISSVPVIENENHLVGVISMTDLLKVGRNRAGSQRGAALLELPNAEVYEHMSAAVVTVAPDDPVSLAAERMVKGRFHRVFVIDGSKHVGVVSTRDVMTAVRDKGMNSSIADWMSSPALTIRAEEPISMATDRLRRAHVTGLIVVEEGWPIGLFTQKEALQSGDLSRETRVDVTMNAAMLVLDESTRLHRAAAQAAALRVRRVIAVRSRDVVGILTGFDFARAAI
jgi:predicted transcriptional regulator